MREAAEINERKEGDGLAAGAKQKAIGFFRREPVLVISFVCAAASMAFVPPSEAYGAYFDWKVLSLLFCLMAGGGGSAMSSPCSAKGFLRDANGWGF